MHYRPFPESVSEEGEIYSDYEGYHCHHVKYDSCLSAHLSVHTRQDTPAKGLRENMAGNTHIPVSDRILEMGHIAGWIIGSTLLAAGGLLIGYALGLRAGARSSNLAKDLRISAQEQRIARLEKTLTVEPNAAHSKVQMAAANGFNGATELQHR